MKPTASLLDAVREALETRLAVVADRDFYARDAEGHLRALQAASAQLDEAVKHLPADTDPRLRHFLERQSYLKALEFLRGEATLAGH